MHIPGWFIVALLTLWGVTAGAQTKPEPADVRGVRWGMTRAEVLAVHPQAKPAVDAPLILEETDLVGGLQSDIGYIFSDDSHLEEVLIVLKDHTITGVEDAFYYWQRLLTKRYSVATLFTGNEHVGRLVATLDVLTAPFAAFKNDHIDFMLQYVAATRTEIQLTASNSMKNQGSRGLVIAFTHIPPDNF
jgi:hypothetical protein